MNELGFRSLLLTEEQKNYYSFTFVRNPFDRLVSAYVNKYKQDIDYYEKNFYNNYLFGYLKNDNGFEDYVERVCNIPEFLLEKHIYPQYKYVYKDGESLVDFIGKYENLENDFKAIQEEYHLYPLPHINQSFKKDYRDYYTLKTAKKVYKKYKKDIELFGYEEAYQDLIEYIKKKSSN